MEPLKLVKLSRILSVSKGSPRINIGIIDGPIDFGHPAFKDSNFKMIHDSDLEKCNMTGGKACEHGTLIAGILASKRGSLSPSLCPNCTFIINPIFSDNQKLPFSSPEKLAIAIVETVDAGASIINLSVSLSNSSLKKNSKLEDALNYAISHNVLIVTAAGNQGKIAVYSSFNKMNTIIVSACDPYGFPAINSNLGGRNSFAIHIMSPGINIISTKPDKGYMSVGGTSIATPFVTGTMALICSIFPELSPWELRAILSESHNRNRTIVPPILDAELLYDKVNEKLRRAHSFYKTK